MASITTPSATTLDLRGIQAHGRKLELLSRFDALAPGERLLIRSDSRAHEQLEALQRERKGLFEWTPARGSSGVYEIEVSRREATLGQRRSVLDALAWDHDRLDALDEAAFHALATGDAPKARSLFAAFARGLERHIRFEEELLFPVVEERAGFSPDAGPTAVMRFEHIEIRARLAEVEAALATSSSSPARARAQLHAILEDHNLKEEQLLYPLADSVLGPDDSDGLVGRIQRFV